VICYDFQPFSITSRKEQAKQPKSNFQIQDDTKVLHAFNRHPSIDRRKIQILGFPHSSKLKIPHQFFMGHARGAVEVAKTVLEVADLAWSAVECLHHHHHDENPNPSPENPNEGKCSLSAEQLEDIRKENRRLRELLEQNLKLLQNISASPCFRNECPPDVCLVLSPFRFALFSDCLIRVSLL